MAFLDLEKSGLLRDAPDEVPVIEASDAASVARPKKGGRPQTIAYQKRARAGLEDRSHSELKRLRVSVDHFQR